MKVTCTSGVPPKVFVPFTLTIHIETLEEAGALRAASGGISREDAERIGNNACAMQASGEAIENALRKIARPIEAELRTQDLFGKYPNPMPL